MISWPMFKSGKSLTMDVKVKKRFVPEPDITQSPERNLYVAMLERAIRDAVNGECAKIRREARFWITKGDIGQITFNDVCEVLSITGKAITTIHTLITTKGIDGDGTKFCV